MTPPGIFAARRWHRIGCVLASLERLTAGAARLDAYVPVHPIHPEFNERTRLRAYQAVQARLVRLELRIDHELDRITAELLMAQLTRQQMADRPRAARLVA